MPKFIKTLLFILLVLSLHSYSFSQQDEKIRSGYGGGISPELLDKLKAHGFNAYMWKVSRPSPVSCGTVRWEKDQIIVDYNQVVLDKIAQGADWAYERGIKLFICTDFSKYSLKSLKQLGEYGTCTVEGSRSYMSRGSRPAPWPGERKYWNGILQAEAVCIAELAKEHKGIYGFLADIELYAGNLIWRYNTTFDDNSFNAFRDAYKHVNVPMVESGKRLQWLRDNKLLDPYYTFLGSIIFDRAKELAETVKNVNPNIELGIFPYENNWFFPAFVDGLSDGYEKPIWIFSESEYILGYSPDFDNIMSDLKEENFKFRYVSGLHILRHQPTDLSWQAEMLSHRCQGYWLFTTASLFGDPDRLTGHYKLAPESTQQQYWDSLNGANKRISKGNIFGCNNLLTPNIWTNHEAKSPKAKYTYSKQPNGMKAHDDMCQKLFDGGIDINSSAAWLIAPENPEDIEISIDFGRKRSIQRVALSLPKIFLSHLRILKNYKISIYLLCNNDKELLTETSLDELERGQYFNIDHVLPRPLDADKLLIVLQPPNRESIAKQTKQWDGIYIAISEIVVWGF